MTTDTRDIISAIQSLPPDLQQKVGQFVGFMKLLDHSFGQETSRSIDVAESDHDQQPKFEWAGCLSDLAAEYTSVELQHAISEWWIEDTLRTDRETTD
jgi:hypothetical protein